MAPLRQRRCIPLPVSLGMLAKVCVCVCVKCLHAHFVCAHEQIFPSCLKALHVVRSKQANLPAPHSGEYPTLWANASLWSWINNSESWHSWVEPLLFMVGIGSDRWLLLILRTSRQHSAEKPGVARYIDTRKVSQYPAVLQCQLLLVLILYEWQHFNRSRICPFATDILCAYVSGCFCPVLLLSPCSHWACLCVSFNIVAPTRLCCGRAKTVARFHGEKQKETHGY